MKCLDDWCRSPVACGGFGYCRQRNWDGKPCYGEDVERRKREQLESEQEVNKASQ